ncbi:hypothetical protein [Fangia hongkongensis]|uniref:hypothetical protein n=1 Tax=Fangia hongkongensis TaxID=270495 RepID=UPI00037123B6|nr:hypothetical protein [Fangia hongkongensis]MBK2126283.1 hypothetical protein [Fangia hongkongensis]
MSHEEDMRSFKGNRLNEQAKVLGIHPLTFILIPVFVMVPSAIVRTIVIFAAIFAIVLSIKGMRYAEFRRLFRRKFKHAKIVRSSCPVNFQKSNTSSD